MSKLEQRELIIIGGGSAGLAAAIQAYDEGVRDILILERDEFLGGILNQCIHNGFGLHEFKEQLSGPEYAERFINRLKERHIDYRLKAMVIAVTRDKIVSYTCEEDGYVQVQANAIVLATGCYERSAGAIAIPGDRPVGVITAGQAQHYLNIDGYLVGKKVFILGSGDIGLIMARRMVLEGAKVLGVAEIMPYSNGLNRNIVQCLIDFDIPLFLSHSVSRIVGKEKLEKIIISQVDANFNFIAGTEKEFEVDTLLLSIGLIPNNYLLDNIGVIPSKTRGAVVNEHLETMIGGVFSCGNVLHVHDLVDFVSEEGRLAGHSAALYLAGKLKKSGNYLKTIPLNGISYIVPQYVNIDNIEDKVALKFRPVKPLKDIWLITKIDGVVVKKQFKPYLIPSEMVDVSLDKALFHSGNQELTLETEAKV